MTLWKKNNEEQKEQYTRLITALNTAVDEIKPEQDILMTILIKMLVAKAIRIKGPTLAPALLALLINECFEDLKRKGIIYETTESQN